MLRTKSIMTFALSLLVVMSSALTIYADGLVINEFLAINDSVLADEDGDYSDWIEIYNGSSNTVVLDGWFLTDDDGNPDKWRIPNVSLNTGEYVVVFASNKDRDNPASELHTDFKLSGDGEYLALVEPDQVTVHHAYSPEYPAQVEDVSFGVSTNILGDLRYFATPTPDAQNGGDYLGLVEDTKFSVDRGFYSNTFVVAITSETAGATIHYTTDFTEPDEILGTVYSGPVTVSNTTCLRALAFLPGWRSTDLDTHTYIFLDQVIVQPVAPAGFPTDWKGTTADYQMDPDITTSPAYSNQLLAALSSLPSISIVTEMDNLFDSSTGIYANPSNKGEAWERPSSAEWIYPDGSGDLQINCGLRIQGGWFRPLSRSRKNSFRLLFKQVYGASKLKHDVFPDDVTDVESFDTLVLRANANDGYSWSSAGDNVTFIRDEWGRHTQVEMGHPGSHGTFVHLYVNGLYWGLYNPAERPNNAFAASYCGGDKDEWDSLNHDGSPGVNNGSITAWNAMISKCQDAASDNDAYMELQARNPDGTRDPDGTDHLDVINHIDYLLINHWGGNWDWPWKNYWMGRDTSPDSTGFKFFNWDTEDTLATSRSPLNFVTPLTDYREAAAPYGELKDSAEFRLDFGDRIHRHMFNDGLLTTNAAIQRFTNLASKIELAIIVESARWGDMHSGSPHTQADWIDRIDNIVDNYLHQRWDVVFDKYREINLYPGIDAPVFARFGGLFTNGYTLAMSAANTIYYTLDGTDPREYGTGTAAGTIYSGAVPLTITSLVKARAYSGSEWSALNEAVFVLEGRPTLEVTEIMYRPREPSGTETNVSVDRDEFEFVELKNSGGGTLGLAGLRFTNGISFDFTYGDVFSLTQGEYVVVVENIDAFTNRYGSGIKIAGQYSGALDNGGERLALSTGSGSNLLNFSFNDSRAWPTAADGAGHSLVPIVEGSGDLGYGGSWRASAYIDGSPGEADPEPPQSIVINEIAAHTDTGQPAPNDSDDWIELYNPLPTAVDIGGWYLSDSDDDLLKYQVPGGTILSSGAFMKFSENLHFHTNRLDGSGFGLDKAGERVYLTHMPGSPSNRVVDVVRFKAQENGVALGRYPNGDPYWYALAPTPAAANGAPGSHVVISEIMYHPAPTVANPENNTNDEYVKIYNPLFVPVELWNTAGVWRIDGGIGYRFPSNTTIAAKDELVLVSFDPVTNITARNEFLAHYDLDIGDVTFLGPYSDQLDNRSDRVALEMPIEPDAPEIKASWVIVDEVIYYHDDPWPTAPDGTGPPLYRTDIGGAGNDPASWTTDPPGSETFEITSLSLSGGTPLVSWHGLTNGEWYVERSTNLSSGFTLIATTTVTTVYNDTALPAPVSESYYRISVSVAGTPVYTRNTAGYLQLTLPSNGYSLVSMPYQKFPLYRGEVSSNTTLTITDDDASWTAGEFAQGAAGQEPTGTNSFFVEIRDQGSAFEGKMFPITTNSATELQIEGGVAAGLTTDVLARASYVIVPEQRVRDIFGEPDSPLLVRGAGVGSADNILFWSGTSWQRIYNKDSGNPIFLQDHWLLGNTVVDDKAIGRDAAFFLFRQATSNSVLHLTGEVPAYNQWIDLDPGYNLVGGCWIEPVSIGNTSLQGTLNGGGNSATADTILEWGGSSWLGAIYYKTSGNPPFLVNHWVRGTTILDTSFKFVPAKGYFIKNSSSNVWHKTRTWNE
ncbi:MAG: lamin tail domain-containing protein [Kiritimatiellia bacterium]|nr:lamin tail domain-containing protein [Kiritimatiellia bacterium]